MRYWIVLLGVCVVVTIFGTLAVKRPILTAVGVSLVAAIGTGLYGARNSPLWIVGSVVVIVCSVPVTVLTAILTEKLMEQWGSRSSE